MVLLKNDGTLPLDPESYANVLVTGPLADDPLPMISRYGPGRSDVITPLAGIKEISRRQSKSNSCERLPLL